MAEVLQSAICHHTSDMNRTFAFLAGLVLCALAVAALAADDQPVPPEEAAAKFTLPPGFKATLFAGEPDVVQPIAFTFDDRGRLWVVECHTYPDWDSDRTDRVLILEDTNGDGRHDKRTVFWDEGKNLTGIEYGFGGIWLTAVPNLIFIPDANGDDRPDGPPEVKLDGWDLNAKHNVVNGLAWGPDGWLWGLNGILSNSLVGKPGTPDDKRTPINCGVWRYHPVSGKFDVVAHGTTNPWGLDFDEYGEAFITNCVIKHAFHVIPGAHFERMFGQDLNPRTYRLMPSIADHIHWGGGHWTESRGGHGEHDAPGGGHAHSGCMIYLGDNWPEQYRGRLYTCNIHGSRVNQDRLDPKGSSYVARHEPDFMLANDPWFRGLAIKYGPDGGVYVTDWSDSGECHDYDHADRTNGRIYKITYGEVKPFRENLRDRSDLELVANHAAKNAWRFAHARRILQERAAAGTLERDTIEKTRQQVWHASDAVETLRLVWFLSAMDGLDDRTRRAAMSIEVKRRERREDAAPLRDGGRVAAAVIRLEADRTDTPNSLLRDFGTFLDAPSPHVKGALAWLAMKRPETASIVLTRLSNRGDRDSDTDSEELAYLLWYSIERNFDQFRERFSDDIRRIPYSLTRRCFARRMAEPDEADLGRNLEALCDAIARNGTRPQLQADVAFGMFEALDGRRDVKPPRSWRVAYLVLTTDKNPQVREVGLKLALIFGDQEAIDDMLRMVADKKKPLEGRSMAVTALSQGKIPELKPRLIAALDDEPLRPTAIRHLPAFADPETPALLLGKYAAFDLESRREAIGALTSRPDWAKALLDAVEQNQIAKSDFTAYHLQQLALLGDEKTLQRTEKLFGSVRPTKEDRAEQIALWKEKLSAEAMLQADVASGKRVFERTCANCHKLFDAGGSIGPELTGAQRNNLDYVLTNVIDPSAVVPRDYQMQVLELADGRVVVGIVKEETDAVVSLQTSTALLKIAKSDIEDRTATSQSMMPEGLIQPLSFEEVRDLVAFLAADK
jgi:putative membrane-bound dehydrogenase-like protein